MGDPSLVGSRTHMHAHWRASVGHRHTRRASARPCLMGDPSQDAAPAAFQLGAAIKARYLQVFKANAAANATLALHPCQTAAAQLPCTRPSDHWGLFPAETARTRVLDGPRRPSRCHPRAHATQGLNHARLCLMGDPWQHAALPPSDSGTRAFGGLNRLEGFLPLPSEGYSISKTRTSSRDWAVTGWIRSLTPHCYLVARTYKKWRMRMDDRNSGGVGPVRGLRGGGRGGWCEEWARSG